MLDSFRTHASTTGPQWEASFQRIISKAEGKASGPQQRPMPKFTGHLTRVQETVPQQLHWPLWFQKANPHPSQRENHPQSPPNSACYSRSHSIKPQLTELQRPGCGRGEAAGLSRKAGWLGGDISAHLEATGRGTRVRGSGGDVPHKGRNSHTPRLHSLPCSHLQPHNRSQDDKQGHASCFVT